MSPKPTGRALARLGTAAFAAALWACGSSKVGGPVAGAADTHCQAPDGGAIVTVVDPSTCQMLPPDGGEAPVADYGPTLFNASGDDDDCKYHLSWTATDVAENQDATFTVTVTDKATGAPVTGAGVIAEVFLNDTHPAPNSGQSTAETSPGVYRIGPIRFDQPGTWTVRFHVDESCTDVSAQSPHGHAAFFVDVP